MWLFDADWRILSDTNDIVVVGDIIRFFNPDFIGRYPHGKYCGTSIVIAEVIKVGRQYYHLKLLAYKGNKPRCKAKNVFRKQFGTVYYHGAYRLQWSSESLRMISFRKLTKIRFNSFEDYKRYITEDIHE